jgi:hypothetical protein
VGHSSAIRPRRTVSACQPDDETGKRVRDAGDRAGIVGLRSARDGRIPLFSHPMEANRISQPKILALQCQGGHLQRIWLGTKLNAGFDLCERALPLDKNNIRALGILALEYLLAVKQRVERALASQAL